MSLIAQKRANVEFIVTHLPIVGPSLTSHRGRTSSHIHLGCDLRQQLTLRDLERVATPTLVPETGAILILKGDIAGTETGQPVTAKAHMNDQFVRQGVTQLDLRVRLATDRLTEICVEALGYYPWGVAVRGGGKGQRMEGPIKLIPIKPTVPGVQTG
jgi:hypothetical protein